MSEKKKNRYFIFSFYLAFNYAFKALRVKIKTNSIILFRNSVYIVWTNE